MSLEIVLDENLSNQCKKILVYPYFKPGGKEKDQKVNEGRRESLPGAL